MAAENVESTTTQEAIEHVVEGGERRSIHYQGIVSYGVAVMLADAEGWLNEHLGQFDAVAHAEREREAVERQRAARPHRSMHGDS